MTQQFTTPSGEIILVVQFPKDAHNIRLRFGKLFTYRRSSSSFVELFDSKYEPIGLLDDLTEEECEPIADVNEAISRWEDVRDVFYINHMAKDKLDIQNFFCKPKESLTSRIRSLGFDTENYRHFLLRKV